MQAKTTGASVEEQIAYYTKELVSRRSKRRLQAGTVSKEEYETEKRREWAAWNALDSAVKRLKPP